MFTLSAFAWVPLLLAVGGVSVAFMAGAAMLLDMDNATDPEWRAREALLDYEDNRL